MSVNSLCNLKMDDVPAALPMCPQPRVNGHTETFRERVDDAPNRMSCMMRHL